jgi:hypothetical protein
MKTLYGLFRYKGAPVYFHVAILLVYVYYLVLDFLIGYYNVTRGLGIPIHLFGYGYFIPGLILGSLATATAFIALMIAHELGHAFFANHFQHRVVQIRIFPFHGRCEFISDPRSPPETLIYAGGLIVQLLIFILWSVLIKLLTLFNLGQEVFWLRHITRIFINLNAVIFIINSLPFPGLDGYVLWPRISSFIRIKFAGLDKTPVIHKSRSAKSFESPEKIVDLAIKRAQNDSKS